LRVVHRIGEKIVFSVPTGAFGNLFAGYLARAMGLPVERFICATNTNTTLHRLFSDGIFAKSSLKQNLSSAIDIVIPYNIWRFLYFNCNCDSNMINTMMQEFDRNGAVTLDQAVWQRIQNGYTSTAITDAETLAAIKSCYCSHNEYLLDPHGAVAVKAIEKVTPKIPKDIKIVCLATAHPAKFPEVTRAALNSDGELPESAKHRSLSRAENAVEHQTICELKNLEDVLVEQMTRVGGKG
jgi:threonine synthase